MQQSRNASLSRNYQKIDEMEEEEDDQMCSAPADYFNGLGGCAKPVRRGRNDKVVGMSREELGELIGEIMLENLREVKRDIIREVLEPLTSADGFTDRIEEAVQKVCRGGVRF